MKISTASRSLSHIKMDVENIEQVISSSKEVQKEIEEKLKIITQFADLD